MTVTEDDRIEVTDLDQIEVDFSREQEIWASYSSLTQHRVCPQRWNYSALRRLEQLLDQNDPRVELEMGLWWHALLAADSIDRGREIGTLEYAPGKLRGPDGAPVILTDPAPPLTVVGSVLDTADLWWAGQSTLAKEIWSERVGEALPGRLRYLYDTWRERWAGDREHEIPLAVELGWKRELPMPKGHPRVILVGYVDEVFRDTRRNLITVRDHKLHKTLGIQTTADDMMDSQLQLYTWGASPTISSWNVGKVQAVAYDRARMVAPKSPQVTVSGGLSKSVTDFDARTYEAWSAGPDGAGVPWGEEGKEFSSGPRKGQPKFGRYALDPAVLEKLITPTALSVWHQRTRTPLNLNLIKSHLQAAVDSAVDMIRTRARVEARGSAQRNLTMSNCRWCDFAKLCRVEMVGGPHGDYVLTDLGLRAKGARR